MGLGHTVAGRYRLEEVLGEGGQATVYKAVDLQTQRHVAVKVLDGHMASDETVVARVIREQQAMVSLAGTSAVEFIDLCAENGTLCLVLELLEGTDLEVRLAELARAGRVMPVSEIVRIMQPLVDTLDRAHAVGIVHRDLKPSNIFLLSERLGGGSRLLDFGLANLSTADPLTAVGTVMGSPSYIAPESWAGVPGRAGEQVDVYSLGVILFRMLSGRMPFIGKTLMDKMRNAMNAERPSLHELRQELPPQVDIWVERALAVDPRDRFASPGACFGELLWALKLAPHPSEQKRAKLSPAHASSIRSWLETDAPRFSSRPPVHGAHQHDEPSASDDDADSEKLPFLSIEPVAVSQLPTKPPPGRSGVPKLAALPPIPRAPSLPGRETSSGFTRSDLPSMRAPKTVPEQSGLRSNLQTEDWEASTTCYERPIPSGTGNRK